MTKLTWVEARTNFYNSVHNATSPLGVFKIRSEHWRECIACNLFLNGTFISESGSLSGAMQAAEDHLAKKANELEPWLRKDNEAA